MNEQAGIKPLEQAYYKECGTYRTGDDRPNYKHWLEQRVTRLEAEKKELLKSIIYALQTPIGAVLDQDTRLALTDALKER
jgi:hypothetical protein